MHWDCGMSESDIYCQQDTKLFALLSNILQIARIVSFNSKYDNKILRATADYFNTIDE